MDDLENYLFESRCMKRLFKARPGNKFIVIGGTSGMRDLAEKNPEKVFILANVKKQYTRYWEFYTPDIAVLMSNV